ncbi:MAG: DUF4458 domain-containing protein [Bacteroidales bacterium]
MKNLFRNICLLGCVLVSLLLATGCSDDKDLPASSQFGYLQLKLQKKMQTFALTGGSELENLGDAKKIQIDLLYNNKQLTQTLNVASVSSEAAEFGLTSETIQLLPGEYTITGYKIYGEYIEGVTPGDKAPILQEGEPDETTRFLIVASEIRVVNLDIVAQLRGQLSLILNKDFSEIQPETKAAGYNPEAFRYNDIAKVQIDLKAGLTGGLRQYTLNTRRAANDYLYHTDTISLRVNDYQLVQMRLLDKNDKLIMVVDETHQLVIENQTLTREKVDVEMPMTEAFRDYIALYNLWKKMDGENWYWVGNGFNQGANFLFTYSDGTPRPLDLWGNQPGVSLAANGRILALNLGAFNPKGMVPDEIGQFTEMQSLYLGNQSDQGQIDPNEGMVGIDKYDLMLKGVNITGNRMAIAKEIAAIRYPRSSTLSSINEAKEPFRIATYGLMDTNYSNRITGVSEEIGKCKNLQYMSVANNMMTDLPASMEKLEELTDLVLINSHFSRIPASVLKMKNLVAFSFSEMEHIDHAAIQENIRELFDGPSKEKIQLLYLAENGLRTVPDNMGNLTALGLLDLSGNKLTTVPAMGDDVSLVQCFVSNNELTSIPEDWFKTDDLEKLDLSVNKLTTFPNMFDAKSRYQISEVDLSGNLISRMPEDFKGIHVEILNLNSNKLTSFPEEFSETGSLFNFIQISNNQIDTISPASISNMKYLKALECSGNKLRYMPYEFNVEAFPYMTGIDLSMNQFAKFPIEVLYVNYLTELRIASQFDHQTGKKTLTEWPDGIETHPALRVLDISNNDVRKVLKFPSQLNFLNIQANPNIYIAVPQDIQIRMALGTFLLVFDEDQNIEGI